VNVSSINKDRAYPIPEFSNVVESLTQLKIEVAKFRYQTSDEVYYFKLLKKIDDLEESIYSHFKELSNIEQLFIMAASAKLTKKQMVILRWLIERHNKKTVYTVLIQEISRELEIPKSTVRWNLKGLRDADLIKAGDKNNKGIPVALTPMGRIMADYALAMGD
jgi:DNA-binding MarR family transcriptional regulator